MSTPEVRYLHSCQDWDDLCIDETNPEFALCHCDFGAGTEDEVARLRAARDAENQAALESLIDAGDVL